MKNFKDLMEFINSQNSGVKAHNERVVRSMFDFISQNIEEGVQLKNYLTFKIVERKERKSYNFKTKTLMTTPARRKIVCIVSNKFKK